MRTNLTVKDKKLWKWAKMRAIEIDCDNVSDYIFKLIAEDKKKNRRIQNV